MSICLLVKIKAENMLATNVLGLMAMCRAFAPGMKERKEGHIINIGSIAGHFAYGTGSAYNASKVSLMSLSHFLFMLKSSIV